MQVSEAIGHRGLDDTALVRVFLDVDGRECRHCGAKMHVCDHRRHRIETLEGQRKIVCRLVKCIDRTCPGNHRTVSPESESAICLSRSIFGWDVFCWIGHRRFSRHWSVPQIRGELQDGYKLSTWGWRSSAFADSAEKALKRLAVCIDRGLDCVAEELPLIRGHVEVVRSIAATLDPTQGNSEFRRILQMAWT